MTYAQTAISNLTDFECRISNRVIDHFQATPFLPAGTQQWKAELWNKCNDELIADSGWEASLQYAWMDAEGMFERQRAALEKEAAEAAELEKVA